MWSGDISDIVGVHDLSMEPTLKYLHALVCLLQLHYGENDPACHPILLGQWYLRCVSIVCPCVFMCLHSCMLVSECTVSVCICTCQCSFLHRFLCVFLPAHVTALIHKCMIHLCVQLINWPCFPLCSNRWPAGAVKTHTLLIGRGIKHKAGIASGSVG